jgi:hypothetical protein
MFFTLSSGTEHAERAGDDAFLEILQEREASNPIKDLSFLLSWTTSCANGSSRPE